jgi:hypothetical protein
MAVSVRVGGKGRVSRGQRADRADVDGTRAGALEQELDRVALGRDPGPAARLEGGAGTGREDDGPVALAAQEEESGLQLGREDGRGDGDGDRARARGRGADDLA